MREEGSRKKEETDRWRQRRTRCRDMAREKTERKKDMRVRERQGERIKGKSSAGEKPSKQVERGRQRFL